jgi:hypothetical protein
MNLSLFYLLLHSKGLIIEKSSHGSRKIKFFEKIKFFGYFLYISVSQNGTVSVIFKGKKSVFKNPFGDNLTNKFQLFVQDNIVVLFSGRKFVSFVFKKCGLLRIEYNQYPKCLYHLFDKENIIVLVIDSKILSFTLEENGRFTMRNYPNRYHFYGGILDFIDGIPYFVYCCHLDSCLIVKSMNLITGRNNIVLKMTNNDYFSSFETRDGSIYMTTTSCGNYTTSVVDPVVDLRKIHESLESWRQDGGIFLENLLENVLNQHQSKIIFTKVLEELMKKNE